jgi:prevent-host-death family protein
MNTIITSRDFNQDTAGAKRAAELGPVIITDRGKPAHVLLTVAAYEALVAEAPKITRLLAEAEKIEFEAPRLEVQIAPARLD